MFRALQVLGLLAAVGSAAGLTATSSINLPGAEIVAYHEGTKMVYVIGGGTDMYVVDASNPSSPVRVDTVPLAGDSQSVSVNSAGLVAVAVGIDGTNPSYSNVKYHADGMVQLFERVSNAMVSKANITVGPLPDSLAFSPDGTQIVTANEGEPNMYYGTTTPATVSNDPAGSISIIDVNTADYPNSAVTTLGFSGFNRATLEGDGVRISGPNVEQDMEPEYVTIEGTTAYVSAQENNAIIAVDLVSKTIMSIKGAGEKDWTAGSLVVDTSDKDGEINPGPRQFVGLRMPDGMDSYQVGGETYVVMANEGDGRVRPDEVNLEVSSGTHLGGADEGFLAIETTPSMDALANLTDPMTGDLISIVSAINSTHPAGHEGYTEAEDGDELFVSAHYGFMSDDGFYSDEERLYKYDNMSMFPDWVQTNGGSKSSPMGRLKTVSTETDTDADSLPDRVVGFGGRSFSIMKASDGSIVYDSGDATEQAAIAAGIYDDGRSDDKGTEPEGVTLAVRDGRTYAFVALERVNAVMVFDVTSPTNVSSVMLLNTNAPADGKGPECVVTNTADDLVIVANEAGTTGLVFYSLTEATTPPPAAGTGTGPAKTSSALHTSFGVAVVVGAILVGTMM